MPSHHVLQRVPAKAAPSHGREERVAIGASTFPEPEL